MTDLLGTGRKAATERTQLVRAGLRRRHRNERAFRILGIVAICCALGFVALLFTDVLRKGIPAFHQASARQDSRMPISTPPGSHGSAAWRC